MNLDKIRKQLAGGFRPFVIRTSDGREFDVPHPEFIAVGKGDIAGWTRTATSTCSTHCTSFP